jgi:deazaflavin-dependent oxidoreductase (nitroreductase family)
MLSGDWSSDVCSSDLVVRGSNGGGPTDPHWVHNVRAHSHGWLRIRRKTRPVHVHVAQGQERERIYEVLCRKSATTERYQQMCSPRELPLVVLRDWDLERD